MRKINQLLGFAACGVLTAAVGSGCSTPNIQKPTETPTPPVSISKPIDLSPYFEKPCTAAPETVGSDLGLTKRTGHGIGSTLVPDSPPFTCEIFKVHGQQPTFEIRLYPNIRPLVFFQKQQLNTLVPTSVHGYPAGIWKINTAPGYLTSCQTVVDLADDQGLSVLYNGPPYDKADGCALAQQAAETVVSGLVG
jgi:hypothetical protein